MSTGPPERKGSVGIEVGERKCISYRIQVPNCPSIISLKMHYIIGSVISMSRSPKWRRGYTTDSSQANGKAIDATSGCSLLRGPANTTGWSGSLVPKKNKRNERERERGGGSLPFKLERDCVATLTMPLQMHNVIATRKRKYKRKTYLPDEY